MATSIKHRGWKSPAGQSYLSALDSGIEGLRLTSSSDGCDVKLFGDTPASNYALYDASAGKLGIVAAWSTAAATGRPFEVDLTISAALGSYSNAIKGYVAYGTSGYTTGLGSAVNAEILLSAGTTQGTYAPLESELVANSDSVSTGTSTSFLYCNIGGTSSTGITTINTNGYFLEIGTGIEDVTGGIFDAITATPTTVAFTGALKCKIDGTIYYIPLGAAVTFE